MPMAVEAGRFSNKTFCRLLMEKTIMFMCVFAYAFLRVIVHGRLISCLMGSKPFWLVSLHFVSPGVSIQHVIQLIHVPKCFKHYLFTDQICQILWLMDNSDVFESSKCVVDTFLIDVTNFYEFHYISAINSLPNLFPT